MRRVIVVVLAVAALITPQMSSGAYGQAGASYRYVVVFAAQSLPGNAADVIRAAGGELVTELPQVGVAIAQSNDLRFPTSLRRQGVVLAVSPEGSWAAPDLAEGQAEAISSEAFLTEQSPSQPTPADDLYNPLQWNIRRVRANEAWNAGATGSPNVVVAVIDNGVASNHPDLAPNLVSSACFSSPAFSCLPYPNIPTILPPVSPGDADGTHGTMVAGIIAAAFGNGRVVGVGPHLGIASYNVYEPAENGTAFEARDGSVWTAMVDAAERTIGQGRVRVINLSLGCYIRSEPFGVPEGFRCASDTVHPSDDAAIWAAWNRVVDFVVRRGVVVVASAGNRNLSVNGQIAHIPGDLPQVINVGATGIRPNAAYPQTGSFDVKAFYANFGAAVDLVAPGGDCGPTPPCQAAFTIVSTAVRAGPSCAATASCGTIYFRGTVGTSLAAPHVAGVAGLILSMNPNLQPHQVRAILKRTAEKVHNPESALSDRQEFGHGMVDALEAVNAP